MKFSRFLLLLFVPLYFFLQAATKMQQYLETLTDTSGTGAVKTLISLFRKTTFLDIHYKLASQHQKLKISIISQQQGANTAPGYLNG